MAYKQQYDGDTILPQMKGYKMACCDCGLVHRIDFGVYAAQSKGSGLFALTKPKSRQKLRVVFTVYRDNRATERRRRKKKKSSQK